MTKFLVKIVFSPLASNRFKLIFNMKWHVSDINVGDKSYSLRNT